MIADLRHDRLWIAGVVAVAAAVGASAYLSPWAPVVLIAGAALLVGGLARPVVLVPAVFAGLLWSNAGLFEPIEFGVNITLGKLIMALALGIWALHAALYERPMLVGARVTAPMVAILVVMLLSLTWAEQIRSNFGVTEIIGYAMLVVMVHWIHTVLDPASLPAVMRAIAWILAPIMAWSLWNTPDMTWWEDYERAEGIYNNANYWCAILLLLCPMLIAFLVEDDHWSAPPLLALIAALLPLNVIASLSRSGFIAFLAVVPFLAWLLWRRKWWVVAGALAVFALMPSFADVERVLVRYQSLVDPSLQEVDGSLTDRGIAARAAIQLFLEHPLHGVGVGMFMPAAVEATSGAMTLQEPHNTYLGIASEQGLIGVIVHGWLFFVIGRLAFTSVRDAPPGQLRSLSVGFVASLVAVAMMGIGAGFMTFPMLYMVLGLGLVLSNAVERVAVRSAPAA